MHVNARTCMHNVYPPRRAMSNTYTHTHVKDHFYCDIVALPAPVVRRHLFAYHNMPHRLPIGHALGLAAVAFDK